MLKIYKNYLEHKQAWDLACSIDGTQPHWWSHVINHSKLKGPLHTYDNVGGYRHRFQVQNEFFNTIQKNAFAYKFHRTTKHVATCTCWECKFRDEVLLSEEVKTLLIKDMGMKEPKLLEYFTSAYHAGDFLGVHTDEGKNGVAFIFHLSWEWKPEYGGLFHLENKEGYQSYVPGWGDLVLMKTGKNHFISEVSELAPRPRIAISGWFSEEG